MVHVVICPARHKLQRLKSHSYFKIHQRLQCYDVPWLMNFSPLSVLMNCLFDNKMAFTLSPFRVNGGIFFRQAGIHCIQGTADSGGRQREATDFWTSDPV